MSKNVKPSEYSLVKVENGVIVLENGSSVTEVKPYMPQRAWTKAGMYDPERRGKTYKLTEQPMRATRCQIYQNGFSHYEYSQN